MFSKLWVSTHGLISFIVLNYKLFCVRPNYMNSNLDVRQQILMKIHFFTCKCRPCQENWPTVPEMESLFSAWTEWQLKSADINQAKNKLQQLLKIAEEKDPTARDSEIKNLLRICFSIFGNRRQI
jgi:hypothetical protein